MSQTTIGILMGLGFTAFMTLAIFFEHDYDFKDCKDYGCVLFLQAIASCLMFGGIGWISDIDEKTNNTIKTTINANYNNVIDYHNNEDSKTFISSDSKYTFEYNEDTKTLIVLKGSDVDAVFVDGAKQKGEK